MVTKSYTPSGVQKPEGAPSDAPSSGMARTQSVSQSLLPSGWQGPDRGQTIFNPQIYEAAY